MNILTSTIVYISLTDLIFDKMNKLNDLILVTMPIIILILIFIRFIS